MLRSACVSSLILAYLITPSGAYAASFDCSKAASSAEFAICGSPQLSSLDEQLSVEYKQALSRNPNVKQFQRDWLRNSRNECGAQVACLTSAYQQQLNMLRNINHPAVQAQIPNFESAASAPVNTTGVSESSQVMAPALEPGNPIPLLFDANVFYSSQSFLSEYSWSDPEQKLFGKPVTQWGEKDFAYLKYRLHQQLRIELNEAAAWNAKNNLKTNPENDSTYMLRSKEIQKVVDSIPRFEYWVQQANIRLAAKQAEETRRRQEEIRAQAEQEKATETARVQARQQMEIREENNRRNQIGFLFLLVVGGVVALIVWNKFIRKRCPRCRSLNFVVDSVSEVDRFRGYTMVKERHSKGVNTRAVSTMIAKNEYDYSCEDCGHKWSETKREEL